MLWSYSTIIAVVTLPMNFIGILVGPFTLLCFFVPLYIVFDHLILILESRTVMEKIYLISIRGSFFWNSCWVSIAVSVFAIPFFQEYFLENSPYINVDHNPFIKYQSIVTNALLLGLGLNYYIVERLKSQVLKDLKHIATNEGKMVFDVISVYQYMEGLFEKGYAQNLLNEPSDVALKQILDTYKQREHV